MKRSDLPKYWRDDQGRIVKLTDYADGKAYFRRVGCRWVVAVSIFELHRVWRPDRGAPIPKNPMPSICNRPAP